MLDQTPAEPEPPDGPGPSWGEALWEAASWEAEASPVAGWKALTLDEYLDLTSSDDEVDPLTVTVYPDEVTLDPYPHRPSPGGGGGNGGGGGGSGSTVIDYRPAPNRVGDTPCDLDEAAGGLLRHAAPGQDGPAFTGKIVDTFLGPVRQEVSADGFTVINRTMREHALHREDGSSYVVRSVELGADGSVYIRTVGHGSPGWLASAGQFLWEIQDSLIRAYVDQNDEPGGCPTST